MSPRQLRAFVVNLHTRERHLFMAGKLTDGIRQKLLFAKADSLKEMRLALVEALETGDDDTDLKGRKRT